MMIKGLLGFGCFITGTKERQKVLTSDSNRKKSNKKIRRKFSESSGVGILPVFSRAALIPSLSLSTLFFTVLIRALFFVFFFLLPIFFPTLISSFHHLSFFFLNLPPTQAAPVIITLYPLCTTHYNTQLLIFSLHFLSLISLYTCMDK